MPPAPAAVGAATGLPAGRWPLDDSVTVVTGFDPPDRDWLPGHRGVDLAAWPGDRVRSALDGTVTFAGSLAGRGVVTVTSGSVRTTYEPVDASVTVGDAVRAGEPIGTIGSGAGHCGGVPACLHWGLRRDETYLDPLLLVGPVRIVLVPPTSLEPDVGRGSGADLGPSAGLGAGTRPDGGTGSRTGPVVAGMSEAGPPEASGGEPPGAMTSAGPARSGTPTSGALLSTAAVVAAAVGATVVRRRLSRRDRR